MSKWISVDDRMPEPGSRVIVVSRRRTPFFARKNGPSPNPNRTAWDYLDGDSCPENITHWMPLPEPPK